MKKNIYMRRALELAQKGAGEVSSNPMVGAVIVYQDRVIGEGYHKKYGGNHAEVNAINSVSYDDKKYLSKSTLYVTLEPCCHYGKTPPCTSLIIENKIPKVIIAMQDPFSEVAGEGIIKLKESGVDVEVGLLEKDAAFLNRRFITYHTKSRPYIILKWAETADGYIDSDRNGCEPPIWFTGKSAKLLVHRWRAEEDAIMVGANSVIKDNPSLTVREWFGKNPIRVTIDRSCGLSPSSNIFNRDAETICYRDETIEEIIKDIYNRGIQSLFIEGGTKLLQQFIDKGMFDEIRRFVTKKTLREFCPTSKAGVVAPFVPYVNFDLTLNNLNFHNLSILLYHREIFTKLN